MIDHALAERGELCATLRATPPDSPTLCGDWTAAMLTAHLVQRERSLTEALGRLPVRRWHTRAEQALADLVSRRPYGELVDVFEAGPPVLSPWALPPVRELVNLLEYAVHHEDVRRVDPAAPPRDLPAARQQAIWQRLRAGAWLTMRAASMRVRLSAPGLGVTAVNRARGRDGEVTVTGAPLELALVCFGRQAAAKVDYAGAPEDVQALRGARLGL